MEIPQIYKQKYIHGHLANLHSNVDSYYIVFLMVYLVQGNWSEHN